MCLHFERPAGSVNLKSHIEDGQVLWVCTIPLIISELFPGTSDLLSHYSFSEPWLHSKGLDPWSQTFAHRFLISGALHRKLQTQMQVKKMRPISQSSFIFFSWISGIYGIFTSTGVCALHFGDPGTHKEQRFYFTQLGVHRAWYTGGT